MLIWVFFLFIRIDNEMENLDQYIVNIAVKISVEIPTSMH